MPEQVYGHPGEGTQAPRPSILQPLQAGCPAENGGDLGFSRVFGVVTPLQKGAKGHRL